ncbi:exonuclease 1 [Uranotaenia lowii]|uniref:exonuclease 1 n=1 Tax=Uranotaenia lowii TaxID=190385 RepID=UPI0024786C18|nr:exonuclease 1 [Uranotaenia lowii]
MGITGLIPFLEKASSKCHLRDLRGQCVAIDSYCWLHKGAFSCADKLVRGEPTDLHIQYCLKYVNVLLSHDIKPILVFDGRHLPAKAMTEAKRRESRDSSRKRAAELLREGRTEEARSFLRRCVDITHEMALQLIQECRKRNVDCVVAPYEADAQLAYLNKKGIAQTVITEDSDLMLFGCSQVLFKLDLTGTGLLIRSDKLHLAMGCKEQKYTFDKFRYMCILSGCDYLDSLPGIGLAKARKFVLTTEETDIKRALAKIPAYLNMRNLVVSEEYKIEFLKADATFKHMIVYDPTERKQTRLNDPEELGTDLEYCSNAGSFIDEEMAMDLALGNVNPFSLKKLDNWHPDNQSCRPTGGQTSSWNQSAITKHPSIWKPNYQQKHRSQVKPDVREDLAIRNIFTLQEPKRPAPNPEFETTERDESIDDVLQAYGIKQTDQPPLKKLCLTLANQGQQQLSSINSVDFQLLNDMECLERSPLKSQSRRNPFQITSTSISSNGNRRTTGERNALLSPTKLTSDNTSLLNNVSPVKRNEFNSSKPLQTTQTTNLGGSGKFDKLSRFKRTIVSKDGQKVISRFFSSSSSHSANKSLDDAVSSTEAIDNKALDSTKLNESNDPDATTVYLLSPEAKLHHRGDKTPKKQLFHHNPQQNDEVCSPPPPSKKESAVEPVDSGFVDEPEGGFSSSQKENETTNLENGTESNKKSKSSRLQLFARKESSQLGTKSLDLTDNFETQGHKETSPVGSSTTSLQDDVIEIDEDSMPDNGTGKNIESEFTRQGHSREQPLLKATATQPQQKLPKCTASASCRRLGLSKNKKSADIGPTQSKLSMFGFQKKMQLK